MTDRGKLVFSEEVGDGFRSKKKRCDMIYDKKGSPITYRCLMGCLNGGKESNA